MKNQERCDNPQWSLRRSTIPQRPLYKNGALPIELLRHKKSYWWIHDTYQVTAQVDRYNASVAKYKYIK
jgi:hypothetical protein